VTPLARVAGLVSGRLSDAAYAGGWAFVRAMPAGAARRLFDAGADLAARRGGKGVDRLRANLERVAPGQDLVRPALRSYARYWLEVFRLPVMPVDEVVARTTVVGDDLVRAAMAEGRGLVCALPHSGNWDTAAVWLIGTGVPFTTVAERLKPESLYDRFVAFRESLGMEVLPLTGGERPPFDVMVERLEQGRCVALMADRDLSAKGVEVSFFGAAARMPAGPASLALRTGAALLPVHLSFTPDGWTVQFFERVPHTDVATMTQALADVFAGGIARHPEDWHMLQRLWLEDLEPRTAVPA
jgi:lauroyl/myristoyl acyltransferase